MSASLDLEPGPVAVGLVVRPVALSAVAVGFSLGAVVFYRRGRRLFALAHGIFGLAWMGLVVGTLVGAGWLVVAAVLLVVAGVGFLLGQRRR